MEYIEAFISNACFASTAILNIIKIFRLYKEAKCAKEGEETPPPILYKLYIFRR